MHDISLYILELMENSIRARASLVAVDVEFDPEGDRLRVSVEDNGEGIRVPSAQALDPFYTTSTRKKVGLGLSLFKAAAESSGGTLEVSRSAGMGGVAVDAVMGLAHVDRPPLGDLASTISTMILANPAVDFRLRMRGPGQDYAFQASEFARRYGLDPGANVGLASSAFQVLRRDLEVWKRIELSSLPARIHAGSVPPRARPINEEKGADA